jgi:plastocyanin
MCTATKNIVLIEKPIVGSTVVPGYTDIGGAKVIRVCVGEDIEFTDASSTSNSDISGYYWDSPYGTVSTKDYVIEDIQQDVKVIHRVYNNCGCYDEEEYKIEIIKGKPLQLSCYGTVCDGATVTYEALNANCNQNNWYVEGGQIIGGQGTPKVTVVWDNPQNGYGIIGLDGSACGGDICPKLMSVKIPVIEDKLKISGQTTACVGEGVIYSVPLYGSTEYKWSITPSSGVYQSVHNGANDILLQFNTAGTYNLTVKYRCDFLDCGWYNSEIKTIVVKPRIEIKGKDKICLSNAANLTTTPSVSVRWRAYKVSNNSQVYTMIGTTFNHVFTVAGKYKITAENSNYCDVAEFLMEVKAPPETPTVSDMDVNNPKTACPNSSILLKGTASSSNYNLIWEPTDSMTATPSVVTGETATINYGDNVCNVNVYNYDKQLGCKSVTPLTVNIQLFALGNININRNIIACPGTEIDWTNNQVPNQKGVLYKWEIEPSKQNCGTVEGNNLTNNVKVLLNELTNVTYPYSFDIYITRTYCSNNTRIDTITITVKGESNINLTISPSLTNVCEGENVSFTVTGAPTSNGLIWEMGDGSKYYNVTNVTHTYKEAGGYKVNVIYNNYNYCTSSNYLVQDTADVIVKPLPDVIGLVLDQGTGKITPYPLPSMPYNQWTFIWTVLGGNPYVGNYYENYAGDGEYCCIVRNNMTGCQKKVCGEIKAGIPPCNDINLTLESSDLCKGLIVLKAGNHPTPVEWTVVNNRNNAKIDVGEENNSIAKIGFNNVGTYTITAYSGKEGDCYSGSYTVTICCLFDISVEKSCTRVVIHNNSKYLHSGTVNYTVNHNGTTTQGSFSTGATTINYPITSPSGTYTFNFSYTDCGNTCNDNNNSVTFATIPTDLRITTSNVASPYNTCNNTPIVLTANYYNNGSIVTSLINSVDWAFGDGSIMTRVGNSINHTFAATNTYSVTATIKDVNGCSHSSPTLSIKSYANDLNGTLTAPGDPICPNNPKQLKYSISGLYSYVWSSFVTPITNPASNIATVFYTGDYSVRATNTNYCKEEAMVNVPFKNKPTAMICSSSDKYCRNDKIELYGDNGETAGKINYVWDVTAPDGNVVTVSPSATEANITFVAAQLGTYTVSLSVADVLTGCSDNATMTIEVNSMPVAPSIGFGNNQCINNPPVNLRTTNSSVANKVYWNTGVFSNTADYYNAGIATAYYYDLTTGCKSDIAKIEIVSAPNFDGLLTGCYEKCSTHMHPFNTTIDAYGLTTGVNASIGWHWFYNGNSVTNGTGNYTFSPLSLPLNGFGDYYLDVAYASGNCNVKSPTLSIEQRAYCPCQDVAITYGYNSKIKDCKIIYTVQLTICNKGTYTDCFKELTSILDGNGINIISVSNSNFSVAPGNCTTITVEFELTNPLLTQVGFTLYDACNECYKDFSIPIELKIDCKDKMELIDNEVIKDLSSKYTAYMRLIFDLVNPTTRVLSFWSEPPQVVNYYYDNGANTITDLNMFDIAKLTQMAANGEEVCFYAIVCENDKLCKREYCMPAKDLLNIINEYIEIKSQGKSNNNKEKGSPYLVPNPAKTSVKVEGMQNDEIIELLLMDISGKEMKSVQETDILNIKDVEKGTYIVRVRSKANKIYYLKLIKN